MSSYMKLMVFIFVVGVIMMVIGWIGISTAKAPEARNPITCVVELVKRGETHEFHGIIK